MVAHPVPEHLTLAAQSHRRARAVQGLARIVFELPPDELRDIAADLRMVADDLRDRANGDAPQPLGRPPQRPR